MTQAFAGSTLLNREVLDSPYLFYRKLQGSAPVWRVPGTEIFVVTDYALLEEATNRINDFSSNLRSLVFRSSSGEPSILSMGDTRLDVLATADPPDHEAHRKMLAPLFTPKKLALLEADIRRTAEIHIDSAIKKGAVEFMSEVANLVPITIINKLIGFKNASLDYLLQAAFDSTAVVGGALSETELVEIGLRAAEVFNWVSEQMATASTSDAGVLSALKSFVNNGQLDIQCAVGMVHLLLSAGGESTTSLIGNAIRLLAEDTSLQETLRQHPVQIANFLEEVLRFEAPFRSHIRSVPRDTALGGVPIPAGALVLLFWAAGNRDPKVFKEPEKFDVNRPRKHMTFGRGIHMCIGAPLARLEAKIVLEELLQRTTSFTLIAGKPPQWVESLQVRRYAELPISLEPKKRKNDEIIGTNA